MRWHLHKRIIVFLFAILVVILVVIAAYKGLEFFSVKYADNHKDTISNYSSAGQFLNFTIGIPMAAIAALFGAWVSFEISRFTSTKDDFVTLKFIDDVSASIFEAQCTVAHAVEHVHETGRILFTAVKLEIEERLKDNSSDDYKKIFQDVWTGIEERQAANFLNLRNALERMNGQYILLASKMHSAMFLREHDKENKENLPISTLMKALPDIVHDTMIAHPTRRQIVEHLMWLEKNTYGPDWVRAYANLPNVSLPIELVGMALWSPYIALANPIVLDAGIVRGFVVNIGGAYLATLYQSLPNKGVMFDCFTKILPHVPDAAKKYLEFAGPDISEYALPQIAYAMAAIFKNPNRLIILQTDNGAVFYDPAGHGDLRAWPLAQEDVQ